MMQPLTIASVVWLELWRRKDLYVVMILLMALLGYLLSLNIFGLTSSHRYIMEMGLLLSWLMSWVLTVNLSSRQLPEEEQRGTIYPLLAKPITRGELIFGKWLGCWAAGSTATLLFYLLTCLVVVLRGGALNFVTLGQGLVLHCSLLGIAAALAMTLSTRLNQDAAATLTYIVSVVCFVFLPDIPEVLARGAAHSQGLLSLVYYSLPHFEVFDMRRRIVHEWGPAPAGAVGMSVLYAVAWSLLLLKLSWLAYQNKTFRRDLAV
jgi:ABC-type transport system involved in multi-copper enzyme maturation permease subunit